MQTRRWTNPAQPQTLQIGVFLLYFSGALALVDIITDPGDYNTIVFLESRNLVRLLLLAGFVAAGYLIANERRFGYTLGLTVSLIPLLVRAYASVKYHVNIFDFNFIGLLFEVALVALLLHPQSRDYQRIWFK